MNLDFGSVKQTRRLPIYLLVDTSASMSGEPIQLACQIISSLQNELMNTPEVVEQGWLSVITFDETAQQIVPLTEITEFVLPKLSTGGSSKLGTAFRVLKEALDRDIKPNQPKRKGDYKASIFLLMGSKSADSWQDEANTLRLSRYINSFLVLFCNENINVDYLKQITTSVLAARDFVPKQAVRQFIRFASQQIPVPFEGPLNRSQMKEVSAPMTVYPFGKVNYWDLPTGEGRLVRATILTDFVKERAKFGLAIDGSHSMKTHFESGYLGEVAQKLSTFFVDRDWHGAVSLIYWGTGTGHKGIQDLGDFSEAFVFPPPRKYGDKTCLLPALKYFTDGIQRPDLYHADWGVFVFLTDGAIEDLPAVKSYCMQLARDLSEGKRLGMIKLLLLGLGDRVDSRQFEALDDLETGTEIDLWDTKVFPEIRDLDNPYELFAEIADPDYILVPGDGIVRDNSGQVVADFREPGLPAVLDFTLPFGEPAFSLEIAGTLVHQPLPFAARGFDQEELLNISPLDIDFGFVENLDQAQSRSIIIHNPGVGIWPGTAESNAAWLKVSPARFECSPNTIVKLRVELKPGAEAHLGLKSNMGLITIRGAGYEQTIRVTVAIRSRFRVLTTIEDRVIDMWQFIHNNLQELSPALLQERFKDLVSHLCERVGLSNLSDPPKLSGDFCQFRLDVSAIFRDTGLAPHLSLVCALDSELRSKHSPELDMLIRDFDLSGRLVMLLILFAGPRTVQEAQNLVMVDRYFRPYDIIVVGNRELRHIVYANDPREALRRLVLRNVNLETINPFRISGAASDATFSGREFELGTIAGNVQEKSYAVVGGRQIGKTSLLTQLHRKTLPHIGLRTLFYDCGHSPGQGFLASRPESWSSQPPAPAPVTFRRLFDSPPSDKPLAVLLDEVDELIVKDAPAGWPVFKWMRALVNTGKMQFVLSGAYELRQALQDGDSPLFNLTHSTLSLRHLEYPAVKQLVTRSMRQLDIDLHDEKMIIDLIWQHTNGHPRVVQGLCARLIERLNKQAGDITARRHITPDDVQAIALDPKFLDKDFLEVLWEQATCLERIIALVLAQAGDRPRNVLEIRHLLREQAGLALKLQQLELALDRLVELRCILKQLPQQKYVFYVEAFPWVLTESQVVNIEILLERYLENYQKYGDVNCDRK